VTRDVEEFFAACERVRFAPSADATGDMAHTLARADAIVRSLERERRLGRSLAAASVLLLLAGVCGAVAATEAPNTLFFQGNALYGEERYAEAAAAYERVLAGGHESANLYFNLGNAYLKSGDVGQAVLAYERARRFTPADPDLRANLDFARTLSGDAEEEPLWTRALLPLASRFGTEQLLLAASGCYTALLLFLALARLLPALRRAVAPTAAVAGVALALLLPAAAYRLWTVDGPAMAVVVAREETSVRFEPAAAGTVHFAAKPGSVLRVLAEREGWAQVARRDGRRGWVAREAIRPL
jgi:tetratricopeptide (TPR) repeat protein